jgi:hypothetical protein
VAQLVIVLGVGELVLGRRLTVTVAVLGHVLATLTARAVIELGLLPVQLAHALDTGPSAAVTAVGACLFVVLGMRRCAVVLSVALLIAGVVAPGLDGIEHVVALSFGLLAGVGSGRLTQSRGPVTEVIAIAANRWLSVWMRCCETWATHRSREALTGSSVHPSGDR